MREGWSPLPIDTVLPALAEAVATAGRAVLQAPPGAGKTTRVPLALLPQVTGRIVMLEPRRLAARAAAERMAETLGEAVGGTVGYRIRGESRTGPTTRIEVVTEGILTRMIQSDPELSGVGAVIFDEFHERSLNADLGLALTWEARSALRPDLIVIVMSATLDAAPVARLLEDAPLVTSEGRAFPVETRWLAAPLLAGTRLAPATAALVTQAAAETEGDILVFLPGEGEIRQVAALLDIPGATVRPLYGALPFAEQRAAIAPSTQGRKIVLSTAIAETSLTIEGVRVVVDAGRARRARFDPGSGMSRLVTERVTRAEAEQRRGRAGRVAPGVCYRLWAKGEEGALPAFPPPEMETADLAPLAMELALWGAPDGGGLAFLTPPPAPALAEARALLQDLGALDDAGRVTEHGRQLAPIPLHPRLGHMLRLAGRQAAPLAALMAARDPLRGAPADLALRLEAVRDLRAYAERRPWPADRATVETIRQEARRLSRLAGSEGPDMTPGEMASLAYPDRIGLRRKGETPRWLLSGGKGVTIAAGDPMSGQRLLVATDLGGTAREPTIRQAVEITEAGVRRLHGERIGWEDVCVWSPRERRVIARRQERLGSIMLDDRIWQDAPEDRVAGALLDGVRDLGLSSLGWTEAAERFRARVELLRAEGVDLPDMSDAGLTAGLQDWLLPHLAGRRTAADLKALDPLEPLRQMLGWEEMQALDRLAPGHFTTPLGNRIPLDYRGGVPGIEVRLQEMFGVTEHPAIGPKRLPLRVTLLSPARRPVQVTTDLPRFWATSYADVRKDMRGQYPRHPWPEDPTQAEPTLRAKPRGQTA
ncbi:ATP-dependent helicase HrpB [Haematobacter genomosp. 1]|uniref:ATP-dependent helicase HrpB n=1 Tax=Haematobacter genomosp. 1 TaxID=366618 RepID=A0A212ACW2_9RHOB|nr:ATP-dependent helicase HrpB [Haematobacter genomosp. 1]OWJ78837.1 ATP-dependent helicase HrpB [Haematobacter genomosp. 1]